jgi:hypothetical protein
MKENEAYVLISISSDGDFANHKFPKTNEWIFRPQSFSGKYYPRLERDCCRLVQCVLTLTNLFPGPAPSNITNQNYNKEEINSRWHSRNIFWQSLWSHVSSSFLQSPGTRQYVMGSGFDNSIYWMISHVVTTLRYYTFKIAVTMTHQQL